MQKRTQARLRILSTKCVHKSYRYLIHTYKQDLALNNQQWLICYKTKLNQPKQIICIRMKYLISYNSRQKTLEKHLHKNVNINVQGM